MSLPSWSEAFAAVEEGSDFGPLLALLDSASTVPGINEPFDLQGQFVTPLVAATALGLEDWIPRLCARGADPTVACLWEGLLCGPLHVAALRLDLAALRQLLDLLGPSNAASLLAESSAVEGQEAHVGRSYVALNALHTLVLKDIWHEEVYQLLLSFGVGLSVPCKTRIGAQVFGLELPQLLGNKVATEEKLDSVLASEVKFMIRHTRVADELNEFLELCSRLKRNGIHNYRCLHDVDFDIRAAPRSGEAPDEEVPPTAMLFAACSGNMDAVRLLLYSGADLHRTMKVVLPYDDAGEDKLVLEVTAVQLALLHGQMEVLEALLLFGVPPDVACKGCLRSKRQKLS